MKKLLALLATVVMIVGISNAQTSVNGISVVTIGGFTAFQHLPMGYDTSKTYNLIIGAPGAGEVKGPIAADTANGFFATWAGKPGLKDTTKLDSTTIVLWWNPNNQFGVVNSMTQAFMNGVFSTYKHIGHLAVTGLSEGGGDWTNWMYSDSNNFKKVSAIFLLSPQPTQAVSQGGWAVQPSWYARFKTYFWCAVATADPDGFYGPALAEYDSILHYPPPIAPYFQGLTCGCHSPTAWGPFYSIYNPDPITGQTMIQRFNFLFPVSTGGGSSGGSSGGTSGTYTPANIVLEVGEGEYQDFVIRNGILYGIGGGSTGKGTNVGKLGLPILTQFADGTTPKVRLIVSGLHSAMAVVDSASQNGYITGLNDGCIFGKCSLSGSNNFVLLKDNLGKPFGNIASVSMSATPGVIQETSHVLISRTDGTVWIMGQSIGGLAGDSTNGNSSGIDSFPTQVPFPAGTFITKTLTYLFDMALDSSGNCYSWGGNQVFGVYLGRSGSYMVPHKIILPAGVRAVDMAGAEYTNYILGNDGNLYTWGFYGSMMGIGQTWANQTTNLQTPTNLMAQQFPGKKVAHIYKLHTTSSAILTDSTFYTWGDNPEGSAGVGNIPNYFTTTAPFQWAEGKGDNIVPSPVQPLPCFHDFVEAYGHGYYTLYQLVRRVGNQLYGAGRNKNGVIPSGIVDGDPSGNIQAIYPESWDDTTFRALNLDQINNSITVSPWCALHPTGSPCSNVPIPTNTVPTIGAGSNQTVSVNSATLAGTAVANGTIALTGQPNTVSSIQWSSSNCNIIFGNQFALNSTVQNLPTGTTPLTLTIRDGVSKVSTATVNITFGATLPPTVSAGPNQILNTGATSITLNGSATGNSGATIVSYSWVKTSGPAGAVITSPTAPVTTVTGLQQTTYVFTLTARDSNGNSASSSMILAVSCGCIALPIPTQVK